MNGETKPSGALRREKLLQWLKEHSPLTGSELARRASVSRQVIVQDITLLKARNEPIMATSQGYIYWAHPAASAAPIERIVAVQHGPERTEEELQMIVDYGVTVKNVIVEHPVYGEITAPILASTRQDVHEFMLRITTTNASHLSELTGGIHLHTLTAPDQERIEQACQALERAGFLLSDLTY